MNKPEGTTEFELLTLLSGTHNPRSSQTVPRTPLYQGPICTDKGLCGKRAISRVSGAETAELDDRILGLTESHRLAGYTARCKPEGTMNVHTPHPPSGPTATTNRPSTDAVSAGGVRP